jgi:hypothetical protein
MSGEGLMRLHNFVYTVAGLVAGIGLTLVAVGVPAQPASAQADPHHLAQKAQVMAVTFHLDKSGFHDLDEALAAGTLPAGALGPVRRARIATEATEWPHPLHDKAKELVGHMNHLEEAIRAEDVAKAAPHAKEVHDVGHDLSNATYQWLAGEQPSTGHGH